MAITLNTARQEPKTAHVDFDYTTFTGTTFTQAIRLPPNAVVTGGDLVIDTAFSASTTAQVGDALTANRYLAATSIASTGRTALVPTGYITLGTVYVGLTLNQVPTAGAGRMHVTYYVRGRSTSDEG